MKKVFGYSQDIHLKEGYIDIYCVSYCSSKTKFAKQLSEIIWEMFSGSNASSVNWIYERTGEIGNQFAIDAAKQHEDKIVIIDWGFRRNAPDEHKIMAVKEYK
jgi:hypothetical protein